MVNLITRNYYGKSVESDNFHGDFMVKLVWRLSLVFMERALVYNLEIVFGFYGENIGTQSGDCLWFLWRKHWYTIWRLSLVFMEKTLVHNLPINFNIKSP